MASQVSWGGELVAFARRRRDDHREAVLEDARDVAFEPAQVIYIGDNALAWLATDRRDQRQPPGDMFTTWQGNSRRSTSM